ncbi:hypothetical protein BMR11_14125, partial [Methylococcaceae bacterium CS5]
TKQRSYAFWGLPALAFALHGWQRMFKEETRVLPEDVYDALNNLFLDVDAYCADVSLRDDEDLDEEDL